MHIIKITVFLIAYIISYTVFIILPSQRGLRFISLCFDTTIIHTTYVRHKINGEPNHDRLASSKCVALSRQER